MDQNSPEAYGSFLYIRNVDRGRVLWGPRKDRAESREILGPGIAEAGSRRLVSVHGDGMREDGCEREEDGRSEHQAEETADYCPIIGSISDHQRDDGEPEETHEDDHVGQLPGRLEHLLPQIGPRDGLEVGEVHRLPRQ
ncbi:hypothetical protein PFISCL1PPCAC_2859 [Pristionchus fissidentatus]|uniref:Uncharacterized protein n=1 Tax=Pristionchus fissidentatus TaxID=1538716 RepID=A0AAV5UZN8_9BILA|nr:hypothetical protein PFISCL1PPCAC_2859 [Pristionchus fissidentatus]